MMPFSVSGSPAADAAASVGLVVALFGALYAIAAWLTRPPPKTVGKVTSIIVYPLKSARGVPVQKHVLDERGLAFDRIWMVVDENGAFLSQRRAPKLATIEVKLPTSHQDPLRASAPGAKPLVAPVVHGDASSVRCWDDRCAAYDQGDAAAAWFANVLGVEGARLVRMADGARRQCDRRYAHAGSLTAFSDGFPLLLASEASLGELNQRLKARGKPTVPMNRFRPNVTIAGDAARLGPFDEDGWGGVSISGLRWPQRRHGVAFGVVKPCARCKMPTIDQVTGVPDKRGTSQATRGTPDDDDEGGGPAAEAEPTATLRTFRSGQLLGYKKPGWKCDVFFGQNLVCHSPPGSTLAVGDEVEATPRRPRGLFSSGVRGVDWI